MRIDILSLFPEIFHYVLDESIIGRAQKNGILDINYINIRNYADDKHNRVDDYPFSGGPGMLLRPQPVFHAYNDIIRKANKRPVTVFLSPRGKVFNQSIAKELATNEHVVLICGHYEGIDQRVIDEICDYELSIGDFVLTGGEIAAMAVCDSVARLVPGVLAEEESYENESHYNTLLEFSQFTRPRVFNGREVPDVLFSGNQKKIDEWKYENSVEVTKQNRPDIYEGFFNKKTDSKKCFNVELKFLGENQIASSEIIMQLNKHFINTCETDAKLIVQDSSQSIPEYKTPVLLTCYVNNDAQNITDVNPDFKTDNIIYKTEKLFCTPSEISNLCINYCMAYEVYTNLKNENSLFQSFADVFDDCCDTKLISKIPYDLYENNIVKFKGYSTEDLFFGDFNCEPVLGDYTLFKLDGKKLLCMECTIFKIKSKNVKNRYVVAYKNLEKIFLKFIVNNNLDSKFLCMSGKNKEIVKNAIYFYKSCKY